ncbi:MAG: efflux RND transporter periplasmic adaptor subunit [Anaerolineales bacterium]|nr:efflux RND transporter periplasmic adaptor subunit [Chloroflexota bacterium]MBL6980019.1 efflux RND transporter periplasmic adaptor subunit [Anaerolineales bacterium]
MKHKHIYFAITFLILSIVLSACEFSTTPEPEDPTAIPVVQDFAVVAEGRLVPNQSAQLSFVTAGQVAEIFVTEGDQVDAGQVLAQLGDREQIESNLASAKLELSGAELELLSAQQDFQTLYDNWPEAATAAQETLTNARQEVRDTERIFNYRTTSADQTDIDVAWSQVVLAEDELDKAKEDFEPYEDKIETDLTRANFQSRLAEAQGAYDDAVRKYNSLVDPSSDFEISQAEADFNIAQARLEQAQEDYDDLLEGPDPDDIALAEARITSAEARISAAQANIASAQSALDDLDLVATFTGTIVDFDLIVGEQVSPGQPIATVVDFSQWYVETDNLTEIEVVDVSVGQSVTIVPDALPDVELTGSVESIDDFFEEKRGDVTYTARILVDEIDPLLRWGMTVVVTFVE